MGRVQAENAQPERIRFRLNPLQRALPLVGGFIGLGAAQLGIWAQDGSRPDPYLVPAVTAWAALLLLALVIPTRFGITLTPSAAIVHNLRRRTIPWADIQAIQIEPLLGSRTVVLHEASGRRTRLRAPITGPLSWDRRFEEKFHTIGQWWLAHRGPDWTPLPPPGAPWGGPTAPGGGPRG